MEEYFSEYGIIGAIMVGITIIVILFFIVSGVLYFVQRHDKKSKETSEEISSAQEPDSEPLLIHCPACGTEVSRYAPACLKCGHPICPTESTRNKTVINIQPEKKEDRGGCLWSILGLIVLIVASIFFNFIGYFIALIILALCRVFSAGEAIFLFIVGLILTIVLSFLGILSLGALFLL